MQKILIVEDDLAIQALLHDFIQEAGYEVTLASDGVEALSYFSERGFDLVLLDIMLPKIDGYGVCEVIRRKSNIPIEKLRRYCAVLPNKKICHTPYHIGI